MALKNYERLKINGAPDSLDKIDLYLILRYGILFIDVMLAEESLLSQVVRFKIA
jgi:hypothetical protein